MARLSFTEAKSYLETQGYRVRKGSYGYNLICLEDGEYSQFCITGYDIVRFAKEHGCSAVTVSTTFDPIFFTNNGFGVEIECYHPTNFDIKEQIATKLTELGINCRYLGYTHNVSVNWKIVTDSSIRGGYGLEVVSPVLHGEAGLEELTKVMNVLEEAGCKVNRSTGLHVHHDMTGCESKLNSVFQFYKKNEHLFDSLMPMSRRGNNNTFCGSLANYTEASWKSRTRYVKLNYQSFMKYGTLEFRHHSGTLNSDKASHWIKLTQAVIEFCKSGRSVVRYESIEQMCSALNLNDEWYVERAMELAA